VIDIGVPEGGPREVEVSSNGGGGLPESAGVLPLRDTVTFPDMLIPLNVGQERSVELVNDALRGDRLIAMVASRNPEIETPGPDDLYDVGVLGTVARMIRVPDGTLRVLVQGGPRVRLTRFTATEPYLVAELAESPDVVETSPELTALMRNVQQTFSDIVDEVPYLPEELQIMVANVDDPSALTHLIAGALRLSTEEKQSLLEETDVSKRLRRLVEILARELEVVAIGSKIQSQVQSELDKGQREYFLRQQLKAIQEELGEFDEVQAEVAELRRQLDEAELPEDARKQVDRELSRLERLQPAMAEYGVIAVISNGSLRCPGTSRRRTISTSNTRARCSTPITMTSSRSRTASSSSWPCES
jgi:ATP-dependent Lon protease